MSASASAALISSAARERRSFISKGEFERITTEFNPSTQGLEPAVLKAMDALCELAMRVPKDSENNEIEETLVELQ